MANVTINQLPAATPLSGSEAAPLWQSAQTVQATIADIVDAGLSNTGVSAGEYGNSGANVANITVDAQGRITVAANRAITTGDINAVPTSRTIATSTGLSGGGDLSANRTLSIADTGVSPATYGSSSTVPTVAINAQGQITSATSTAIDATAIGAVPTSRTLTAGTGLSGGGDLSTNRSFAIANTGVSAGSYGSSSSAPVLAINAQGQVTSASFATITPASIGAATAAQGAKADTAIQPAYLGFTRAEIPSLTIAFASFQVSGNTVVGDLGEGATYIEGTSAGPRAIQDAAGTWFELSCGDDANIAWFGGVGDGTTPDDSAWDDAYDYLMGLPNGGTLRLPSGTFLLNAEHNIYCSKPLNLHFDKGAIILCGSTGAGSVMLDATNPVTPSARGYGLVISGSSRIEFLSSVPGSSVGSIFLQVRYASDLKFVGPDHSWLHYRNNTALRLSGTWNCDGGALSVWGAGYRKPRKSTGTATFSIAASGTTLTASSAVFDVGDVGDIIVVADEMFTISAYIDSTNVTVSRASSQTWTAQRASFGSVRCTTTASSTAVTLESNVATSDDIGRVVYIVDAKAAFGGGSPKECLRATITAVPASNQITLDVAPDYSVTLGEIIFSPAVEIFYDTGTFDGQPNDLVWYGLQIEEHRGTGLALGGGGGVWLPNLKVHCQPIGTVNSDASDYGILNNATTGVMSGQLEGVSCGRLGRVLVTGLMGLFQISEVVGAGTIGQALAHAHNMLSAGFVSIGNWYCGNPFSATTMANYAFTITGSGRIEQFGKNSAYNLDFTGYPQIIGQGRPPYNFLPANTEGVVTRSGGIEFGVMSTSTPVLFGCVVGGSIEAPTATAEYLPGVRLAGMALAPTGTAPIEIGQISAIARSPSGSNIAGQWEISTRDTSGTLATRWVIPANGKLLPATDDTYDFGSASNRVHEIFAANGTINTSDKREKQDISSVPDAWLDAWGDVQWGRFRWVGSVAEKGDAARWHVGLIAQEVDAAFSAHGLDAREIGLLCFDEWQEEPAHPAILDDAGNEIVPARAGRPSGTRWGVRYTECLAIEASWQRREIAKLHSAFNALKG